MSFSNLTAKLSSCPRPVSRLSDLVFVRGGHLSIGCIALEIKEHEPAELNRLLEKLYTELKTKNGQDYEPDSLES